MPYNLFKKESNQKLSVWVYLGGLALSFLGGYINVSMLYIFAIPVSHMSGAVSKIGIDLGNENYHDLGLIALILICFFTGAIISGVLVTSNKLRPSYQYSIILTVETICLLIAALSVSSNQSLAIAFSAMACGVQNSMASSYQGLIIRTTHVTGVVTDLGFMVGSFMRSKRIKLWKVLLLSIIIFGYGSGGIVSAFCQKLFGNVSAYISFVISLLITIAYLITDLRLKRRRYARNNSPH